MTEYDASYRTWADSYARWQRKNGDARAARAAVVHQFREFARGQGEPPSPSILEACDLLEQVADALAADLGDQIADAFAVIAMATRGKTADSGDLAAKHSSDKV